MSAACWIRARISSSLPWFGVTSIAGRPPSAFACRTASITGSGGIRRIRDAADRPPSTVLAFASGSSRPSGRRGRGVSLAQRAAPSATTWFSRSGPRWCAGLDGAALDPDSARHRYSGEPHPERDSPRGPPTRSNQRRHSMRTASPTSQDRLRPRTLGLNLYDVLSSGMGRLCGIDRELTHQRLCRLADSLLAEPGPAGVRSARSEPLSPGVAKSSSLSASGFIPFGAVPIVMARPTRRAALHRRCRSPLHFPTPSECPRLTEIPILPAREVVEAGAPTKRK